MLDALLSLSLASMSLAPLPSGSPPQNPDIIQLKSGRELKGKILSEQGSTIRFDDEEIGHVLVARTKARAVLHNGKSSNLFSPTLDVGARPRLIDGYLSFRPPTDTDPGALETATTRWYHKATDTSLFLVSNSRTGESAYYTKLQHELDSMDLVLFEDCIHPEDPQTVAKLAQANFVLRLQLALQQALDLDAMQDSIDSRRPFWKRADLDTTSLHRALKDLHSDLGDANPKADIMLGRILESILESGDPTNIHKHPRLLMQIRNSLAPILVLADQALRDENLGPLRHAIIEKRNDAVRSELAKQLDTGTGGRRIAIFYGAEHMPDFDAKLRRSGWTYQGSAWHEAWQIRRTPRQARPEALAFREIIEQARDRVHPELQLGVWLGVDTGRALFEHRSQESMLATQAITPLLLIELFSRYADQLDDPAPKLNALLKTPSHPALESFSPEQQATIQEHLRGVSVRRLASAVTSKANAPEIVRDGAMNIIVALLDGPKTLTKGIRRRHPSLSRFLLARYPHALTQSRLGLISARSFASTLQSLAERNVPGLDKATTNSLRDILFSNHNEHLGRHFSVHGKTASGRLAFTRAGFYEDQGHKLVYVIQGSLPDLNVRQRSDAVHPLHRTADWLAHHLTTSLRSRVQ